MNFARFLAVLVLLCCASAARADALDDTLAKFLDDKFTSTEQGDRPSSPPPARPTAPAILEALGDNRLLIDPVAHIARLSDQAGGDLVNAKTGEKLAGVDAASFKKVRVNNALRSAIDAAMGSLTLASPDPAKARRRRRRGVQVPRRQGAAGARGAARQGEAIRAPREALRQAQRGDRRPRRAAPRAPTASPRSPR